MLEKICEKENIQKNKKGLQTMSDKLNSPQPKYMTDVRFTYLLP